MEWLVAMRHFSLSLVLICAALPALAAAEPRPLLRRPAVNRTHIVFSYAGDLWSVPRSGGEAVRLTTGVGTETDPYFSPDGSRIAFTGEYDGNPDVYLMPASGGVPRRVTYHPAIDIVQGWSSDGKRILFRSGRASQTRSNRLFTIAPDGVFPEEIPLPMAEEGSFSPDGSKLAYMPLARAFESWKRYRGGRMAVIWIATLADSSIEKIPRENSNDFNPMWAGDRIYFLSDRAGAVTLFYYDTRTKKVTQALVNDGLDIRSASLGPGAIVYERFGEIWLYDLKSCKAHRMDIRIAADFPEVRPRLMKTAANIRKVIRWTLARAGSVLAPFVARQALVGEDRSRVIHRSARRAAPGRAAIGGKAAFELRPEPMHDKPVLASDFALACAARISRRLAKARGPAQRQHVKIEIARRLRAARTPAREKSAVGRIRRRPVRARRRAALVGAIVEQAIPGRRRLTKAGEKDERACRRHRPNRCDRHVMILAGAGQGRAILQPGAKA